MNGFHKLPSRSGGVDKQELSRFIVKIVARSEIPLPTRESDSNRQLRSIIDIAFSMSDTDSTGEIELDEITENLATGILKHYIDQIGHKVDIPKIRRFG